MDGHLLHLVKHLWLKDALCLTLPLVAYCQLDEPTHMPETLPASSEQPCLSLPTFTGWSLPPTHRTIQQQAREGRYM